MRPCLASRPGVPARYVSLIRGVCRASRVQTTGSPCGPKKDSEQWASTDAVFEALEVL
jgi:hypothetical protein